MASSSISYTTRSISSKKCISKYEFKVCFPPGTYAVREGSPIGMIEVDDNGMSFRSFYIKRMNEHYGNKLKKRDKILDAKTPFTVIIIAESQDYDSVIYVKVRSSVIGVCKSTAIDPWYKKVYFYDSYYNTTKLVDFGKNVTFPKRYQRETFIQEDNGLKVSLVGNWGKTKEKRIVEVQCLNNMIHSSLNRRERKPIIK
jgi:hypothetical protein